MHLWINDWWQLINWLFLSHFLPGFHVNPKLLKYSTRVSTRINCRKQNNNKKTLNILSEKGLIAGDWVLKNCGVAGEAGFRRPLVLLSSRTVISGSGKWKLQGIDIVISLWQPPTFLKVEMETQPKQLGSDIHHPSTCQERVESGSIKFSSCLTQCLKCIQVFNKNWLKWIN